MAMASSQQPLALWTTKAEREKYDAFADLYALIKTVDKLEKACARAGGAGQETADGPVPCAGGVPRRPPCARACV